MKKLTSLPASLLMGAAAICTPNTVTGQGFDITVNGTTTVADSEVKETARAIDVRLEAADVQISTNLVDPEPKLGVQSVGDVTNGQVRVRSLSNYPGFIERGEVRIIDLSATSEPKLLGVVPLLPNRETQLAVPSGEIAIVYRVYGKRGRYDQTPPLFLSRNVSERARLFAEESDDFQELRNIRVRGGQITVSANNIAPGGRLIAFGQSLPANSDGSVTIDRILPSGDYDVMVEVRDGRGPLSFGRDVEIDTSDWTYFVVADLELRRTRNRQSGVSETSNSARLQVFVDGETEDGVEITASVDTGPGPIEDAFRRLSEKDPRAVASRFAIAPENLTFGDDSTTNDLTPTSGRVYLRVQRDQNFILWGDYDAQIEDNTYLRNTRSLYGAQLHLGTDATTENGEERASLDLNAAQRDQLFGREAFRGTDGTVFFLSRQDVVRDTERVTVEVRNAVTGQIVERVVLEEGKDYLFNEFQGVIRLNQPLSASLPGGLIQTNASGDLQQFLVVEYEYTPIGFDGSGVDVSGRVTFRPSDQLRFGVSALSQDTGTSEQRAYGADVRYQFAENSFIQLDVARNEGGSFSTVGSTNAGLNNTTTPVVSGSGEAYKLTFELHLQDVSAREGVIGGYLESRTEGFSTLDYQVDASTGDQRLYGLYARGDVSERLSYDFNADIRQNENSNDVSEVGLELGYQLSERLLLEGGVQRLEQDGGNRTDVAARLTFEPSENSSIYVFGQEALSVETIDANDRFGIGGEVGFDNGWSLAGEVSDGTTGLGLRFTANYEDSDGDTTYAGWEVDPSRTFGQGMTSDQNGRYVIGGRRQVSERVSAFGENTYDLLGQRRELIATYGFDFEATEALSYGAVLTRGRMEDATLGDSERLAIGLSTAYDSEHRSASARLEYRNDEAVGTAAPNSTDSIVFTGNMRWKFDDDQRAILSVIASHTENDTNSLLGGTYVDASLSYAYRPVNNERLNILSSLRYFKDDFGQELDGVVGDGPVQRSLVFNIEGNYDLTPEWKLGAKLGVRESETAASSVGTYSSNDAWLGIANLRYHMVKEWDALIEARHFEAVDTGFSETGGLVAVYRNINENFKIGIGYNLTSFSDDLTDLTQDDEGVFFNIIAQF